MADENQNEPAASEEKPFNDHKRNMMTLLVVGGLMIVEGVGIVAAIKLAGGGADTADAATSTGEGLLDDDGNLLPPQTELRVCDVVAFNKKTGRVFVYQMTVYIEVDTKFAPDLENTLENRQNTIEDRFGRVVRACDPKYLEEDGLDTIKRQFKAALEELVGQEDLIKRVLIPQFSASRAD